MGPSGAGKSTLLDILAFRKTTGKWTQDIRLNGALLSKRTFVKESGYVTSDDLLTPELTCREMLKFGAALRLPRNYSEAQRNSRINDVLEVMRLGYCEHRRIGGALQRGLSTGERKRLNVAMELLPVASVLFLDEPTTGLDSNTGREIIANVVEVTRLRKLACVATIHQPSYTILSQFDYLLALAKGKLCYYGRIADAILYFENLGISIAGNPAEIYATALAAEPDRLADAWESSPERTILQKKVEAIHSGQGSINDVVAKADETPTLLDRLGFYHQAPIWTQFWQLLYRQILVYLRNPIMSTSRFLAAIFTALFFGGAFWQLKRTACGCSIVLMLAFPHHVACSRLRCPLRRGFCIQAHGSRLRLRCHRVLAREAQAVLPRGGRRLLPPSRPSSGDVLCRVDLLVGHHGESLCFCRPAAKPGMLT
ncbi:P-loop containing nucleoside triphosphate hydrolase protein [Hyaloraphidium curvatum]|nr:P-loop containing nucleoside triphosphate hydrolase protein [Hyaloraphidium curvatum]